eukprot:5711142-Lingulodinium_polyedra.AAC.1
MNGLEGWRGGRTHVDGAGAFFSNSYKPNARGAMQFSVLEEECSYFATGLFIEAPRVILRRAVQARRIDGRGLWALRENE